MIPGMAKAWRLWDDSHRKHPEYAGNPHRPVRPLIVLVQWKGVFHTFGADALALSRIANAGLWRYDDVDAATIGASDKAVILCLENNHPVCIVEYV